MKYIILMLSTILFTSCKTISDNHQIGLSEYKVYKIENLNSFYIIYCEKNDQKIKLISKKLNQKDNSKNIKIGNDYSFELVNFPDYSEDKNPLTGFNPLVNCFILDDNTEICKEEGINGLYTTKNLKGLHYVK